MKISVQTGGIEEYIGVDACYRMIREAGFDAVDVNLDHLLTPGQITEGKHAPVFDCESEEEMLSYFKPWKDAAEKYGIDNYQAHAPFRSYVHGAGEYNDYLIEVLKRTIIGCDYIGCHCLIVHPFFTNYENRLDPKTEWDVNIERYSALIPLAKEYGITVCLENMFTAYKGKIMASVCANAADACRYIDTLNDIAGAKTFGFCLDTGHLLLVGGDIKNTMVTLGDRISAFHVHDNNGINDQHLAPYMGVQDWDAFVDGLRAIGYNKTMSFETFNVWNVADKELCPTLLKYIAEAGRMFAKRAEA